MSTEQDQAAVTTPEERAGIAAWADTFPGNEFADTIRRLLADLDAAENIARLAEESEAGWRREADELAERLAAVSALADEATERAYFQIAVDKSLTIMAPIDGRAHVPPHWRSEAEAAAHVPVDDLRAALTTTPTPAAEVGRREESGQ